MRNKFWEKQDMTQDVVHIFWDIAPHLAIPKMRQIKEIFPTHCFSLYQISDRGDLFNEKNAVFMNEAGGRFRGVIKQSFLKKIFAKIPIVKVLTQKVGVEISMWSLLGLLLGPKNIVLHGCVSSQFNLFTLTLLRLFRKRIYLIHWGGKPRIGRFLGCVERATFRKFSHIFVLMSPELAYFTPFMKMGQISCVPYPSSTRPFKPLNISSVQDSRKLILGNSAHQRQSYYEVLDKLKPDEWHKIICMLNYGDETNREQTDMFVKKYYDKFGEVFYPWRETVSFNEYLKVFEEGAFYICAATTQTGLGAIYNSIYQGKTLFLRGDNYKWVTALGIKAYNYDEMGDFSIEMFQKKKLSFSELCLNLEKFHKNFTLAYGQDFWRDEILRVISK